MSDRGAAGCGGDRSRSRQDADRPAAGGVPLAGLWEFPGGKVGPGESADDAAVRECLEETAVRVRVERERAVVEQRYEHGDVRIHFFDASPIDPGREPAPFPLGRDRAPWTATRFRRPIGVWSPSCGRVQRAVSPAP